MSVSCDDHTLLVKQKHGECNMGCLTKEHVEDWVGLQSTIFWDRQKKYVYDVNECLSFGEEISCGKNKGCKWERRDEQKNYVCKPTKVKIITWDPPKEVFLNSSTTGKTFRLLFTSPIAEKIRYVDQDQDMKAMTFYYEVFETMGLENKKYVVLLPSGTFSNVTKEIHDDPFEGDGTIEKRVLNNNQFTEGMMQAVIEDLKRHEQTFQKASVVVFGGHSMGCVLSQKLCARFSSGADDYFNVKKFPKCFFTGSAGYMWSDEFLPETIVENFRQKWFIRKSDVVTRTVGTGYKISVDTLSVSEMRDAIEKNECSMRDHEWKKYSPQIKNWLDGL